MALTPGCAKPVADGPPIPPNVPGFPAAGYGEPPPTAEGEKPWGRPTGACWGPVG